MTNPDTTLPPTFAPLREAADAMAREHYAAIWDEGDWPLLSNSQRDRWLAGHAYLLADLTRPASRDAWARWLAERVGLDASESVFWARANGTEWAIVSSKNAGRGTERRFVDGDPVASIPGAWYCIPGFATADPAEALRAAVLAVGAAP